MKASAFGNGNYARLLSLVLGLLALVNICLAAPHHDARLHYSKRRALSARGLADDVTTLLADFKKADVTVSQNSYKYMDFKEKKSHSIGSDGFQGCNGLVIVSNEGVIVGHYGQSTDSTNDAKRDIKASYDSNKAALSGAKGFVYAMIDAKTGAYAEPTTTNAIIDLVKSLTGAQPDVQKYVDPTSLMSEKDLDDVIEKDKDFSDQMAFGTLVVDNAGGGSSASQVRFLTNNLQEAYFHKGG